MNNTIMRDKTAGLTAVGWSLDLHYSYLLIKVPALHIRYRPLFKTILSSINISLINCCKTTTVRNLSSPFKHAFSS